MFSAAKPPSLRTILQKCLNHIDKLECTRAIDDHYEKEFQNLKYFSEGLKTNEAFSCTEGEKEVNRKKNRYKDILPFNVSRVVLNDCEGLGSSNYVNANYIRGASGSPAYIASQGPLPNTVNDFWRMVVECEVHVIVMACNAEEAGKHKCEDYWVEHEDEERVFGSVEVRLLKANIICSDFLVRTMRIVYPNDKGKPEERTVCQFHYSAWPDHGVPPLVRPLLDMVRLVRDTQASETLPVLVHCSAGCGRTGTICAIDYVWGLLRQGKLTEDFSLFNLVRDMRKQRVAMVQTREQYVLVHQAVRELFREQIHIIDSHPYVNISRNGEPPVDLEPIYETLFSKSPRMESMLEKQDRSKPELIDNLPILTKEIVRKPLVTSPSRRKKNPNIAYSKQEKEVENFSEKNRITISKSIDEIDGSPSINSLRKPKIAKLRALFERNAPISPERSKSKNNSISRSHSLGPVRKTMLAEVVDANENKPKETAEPAIRSGGKLKVPKLIATTKLVTRPVPHIKRSKSLKVPKNLGPPLLSLLQYASADEFLDDFSESSKPTINHKEGPPHKDYVQSSVMQYSEEAKRRRSLESLMGDSPPEITWPKESVVQLSPKARPNMSLKHQFQALSNASQRTMNSLACGLGIRERRNSFRLAINIEDKHVQEKHSVFVDGFSSRGREMLTVRSQNGEILSPTKALSANLKHHSSVSSSSSHVLYNLYSLQSSQTSQSMRLPSKNRFLTRLKTELQNQMPHTVDDRSVFKPEDRLTCLVEERKSSHYPFNTMQPDVEIDKPTSIAMKESLETSKNRHFLGIRALGRKSIQKESKTITPQMTDTISQNAKVLLQQNKNTSPPLDDKNKSLKSKADKMDKKGHMYVCVSEDRIHTSHNSLGKPALVSSASSLSSDMSDNLHKNSPFAISRGEQTKKQNDLSSKLNNMNLRERQQFGGGSESSSSSGTRELFSVMKFRSFEPDKHNGNAKVVTRSKSTPFGDGSNRPLPVAPPRIRRRGGSEHSKHTLSDTAETPKHCDLSKTRNIDTDNWYGAIGVDLDVVAASMLRQKPTVQTFSKKPPPSGSRKQQYL